MKAVKNLSGNALDIDFNFNTYHIDKSPVMVEEDLFKHLQERFPLAFDFEFTSKTPIIKVKSTPTPTRFKNVTKDSDMIVNRHEAPKPMFGTMDGTSNGNIDKDGVQWSESIELTGGK